MENTIYILLISTIFGLYPSVVCIDRLKKEFLTNGVSLKKNIFEVIVSLIFLPSTILISFVFAVEFVIRRYYYPQIR